MVPVRTLLRAARPTRGHVDVALIDVRRWRAGYCNALAHHADPDRNPGGYKHWRCDRRRHHGGPHRGINSTWTSEPRSCAYDPVDNDRQRSAALAADTIDTVPLTAVGRRELLGDSYTQRWRGFLWGRRADALRGQGRPTPGQVLGLLRHRGPVVAALGEARRLARDVNCPAGQRDDDAEHLRYVAGRVTEQLDAAGVPK